MFKKRFFAVGLALTMLAGIFTGCASSKWSNTVAMTVNGQDIYVDEYAYYLNAIKTYVEQSAGEEIWSDAEYGAKYMELANTYAKDQSLFRCAVLKLSQQNGIYITDEAKAQLEQERKDMIAEAGGPAAWTVGLKQAGYTENVYAQIQELSYLYDELYNYYFGENGTLKADEKVRADYEQNYITAAHILRLTVDDSGKALAEETIAQKDSEIQALLKQVNSGADFMKLSRESNDDGGVESNPDGYTFKEGDMVTEFYESAKALKINEISGIVESSYGYHIIKRLPLDMDYYETNKEDILDAYYDNEYETILRTEFESYEVVTNEVVNSINVTNAKDFI